MPVPILSRALVAALLLVWAVRESSANDRYVRRSPRDPRYFELTDGTPYVPIGLNMIGPPGNDLDGMEAWFKKLSGHGGNFVRIWLGHTFFDVEATRSGQYEEDRARRLDELLALARKYDIRLKLCTESFRHLGEGRQTWAAKPIHHVDHGGPAKNTADFFNGRAGREQYKRKLDWFARRFGDQPMVFGWELWNEMDAIGAGDWHDWTREMLPELRRRFPKNLVMQSLGSYDDERKRARYRALCELPGNDVLQVHRYLDLGANWAVCHGPVDLLAAEAVKDLRALGIKKPLLLAESGAVEPRHTGPFKLYAADKAGVILHDVLFAPFFVGAAGPGHIWHWEAYVDRNGLWRHFGRFAAVVKGLDPPAERFEPFEQEHPRLRVYGLRGRSTTLLWCRDNQNDWKSELADGKAPERLSGIAIDIARLTTPGGRQAVDVYDPWADRWTEATADQAALRLPDFSRSIVLRVKHRPAER